jgi:hypothetical protein
VRQPAAGPPHDTQHVVSRRRRYSVASLLVVRYLLVSNGLILTVVGFVSLLYVERPAGFLLAAGFWLFAGLLFGSVPLTDPYRHERVGRRRRRSAEPGSLNGQ